MQLQEFASLLVLSQIEGDGSVGITGIQTDSRKVRPGDLFICLPGHTVDGHDYAAQAIERGAAALAVQRPVGLDIPTLKVKDTRFAMAVISDHFFGNPSHKMNVIGITGTNGKTTTTYLIEKILSDAGKTTGLMGTIRMKIGDQNFDVKNTTQDALDLQRNFSRMIEAGTDCCIMEVSSHALQLGRVKGCDFRTAVFTNLTQDHLDFHETMEKYMAAKGLLFARLGNMFQSSPDRRKYAVLNADDRASQYFQEITSAQVVTYGIDEPADVQAEDIRITANGTEFKVRSFKGDLDFRLRLIGKFSVYNALAAISAALLEGVSLADIKRSLEEVKGVDGRFEAVQEGQDYLVIVDYAHTPDSLENVLATIKEFSEGKIYCVVGCGGDRDRTKRPIMGRIAADYSDYVFVTSDNPRSEDPHTILLDMEKGITQAGYSSSRYELIVDRKSAIQKAIAKARPKDVVLIAGKGHETYQEVKGVRHDFDDRLVAKEAIRSISN
jgi:UDP-N-acetylmuramoyl-L-alanyl-D-glutamate--2,6-diaminopimelate ligase